MATPNKFMRVHSVGAGKVPNMQSLLYATGQTFPLGAVLIFTTGEVTIASTTPTSGIVGVAGQGAGTAPGYDVANAAQTTTYTGRRQAVTVFRPNDTTIFAAQVTNNSSTVIDPATLVTGVSYGLTVYSGVWTVDFNLTTSNAAVYVNGHDDTGVGGMAFFTFLQSVLDT